MRFCGLVSGDGGASEGLPGGKGNDVERRSIARILGPGVRGRVRIGVRKC